MRFDLNNQYSLKLMHDRGQQRGQNCGFQLQQEK